MARRSPHGRLVTAVSEPARRRRRKKSGEKSPSKPPRAARASDGRRSRRLVVIAGLLGVAFSLLVALALWARSSGPGTGRRFLLEVSPDASASALVTRLSSERAIGSPTLFGLYLRVLGKRPEPGVHLLRDDLSPREIAQRLGRSAGRASVRATVPEGYNHVQIGRRLEELEVTTLADFQRAVYDPKLRNELAVPGPSLEGYLFPATYELLVDSDAASIARTLVLEAKKRFGRLEVDQPAAFERLAREQGFRLHEIVTLASVVERETGDAADAGVIAGVFFNRLTDPDFRPLHSLQSDPTAAYGCLVEPTRAVSCAVASGEVTPGMLRDASNRYNTYRHPGLPPGPIGNPGERAMRAVLWPTKCDYLYFVAAGQGKHKFSKTFEEHREAVQGRGK
ncbi:MAG TPA: endolytic transglycosylase MltG [Polyangiaceae bacterium]